MATQQHVRLVAAVGTLACILSACSGASDAVSGGSSTVSRSEQSPTAATPAAEPQIEIAAHGFSSGPTNEYDPTITTNYAAVFSNPDAENFVSARVRFVFKDGDGTVVATEEDFLTAVLPGDKAALAGDLYDRPAPASMEVQVLPGERETAPEGLPRFEIDQVRTAAEEFGGLTTTAHLTNPFTRDLEDLRAVAVYRDSAGNVTGGAWGFVSFVPSSGSTGIELSTYSLSSPPPSTEVYVGLSNLTLLGASTESD